MAHIKKLPNGKTEARYRDPAGKQRSKTFATRKHAEAFLAQIELDKLGGAWRDPALGRIRFGDWVSKWWETVIDLRPSTRARDESYLKNHILSAFALAPIAEISSLDVRGWVASLKAKDLSPETIKKNYQILSKVLRGAVDAGLIAQTPCRGVSLPRIERREMRFLIPKELGLLAMAIDPRYRALVLLGGYGGLRWGELAGLRTQRVDISRREVEVVEIMTEVGGHLAFGPPKTRASGRKVGIPTRVAEELATHIAERRPNPDSDLVFQTPKGGGLRRSTFRSRTWVPAVRRACLDPLRVHDLRHTAVSIWIAGGAHPKAIAVRAGHSSVSVVLDRYGHLLPGFDEAVRDRMDEMFAAAEEATKEDRSGAVVDLRLRREADGTTS